MMDSKPSTDQQYRCKTLNCSKSFKNASSLFRHNKCCISFGKSNTSDYQYGGGDQFDQSTVGVKVSNETHSSSSSNGIRDAACLCDPGEEEVKMETISASSSRIFTQAVANRLPLDEPINRESRKIKKQVILNPDGEDSAAERYDLDDLAIDENQAAKLESYSCYAGVPQRDKAGQFLVWVNTSNDSNVKGAELHCVSRHARLYSQLLGRISSATKKMDSKIVSLANSILEKGHPKNSFNYRGLVQWSFIEKLYATKSTEAKKLIQSFSGSASNRMRVIVGLCNASRVGKMRHRYFTVARPVWVSQLNTCLRAAVISDFGGNQSIRKLFYAQVEAWDGRLITDELVESMLFLRLLYLFHELGYFKASQVNRAPVEGGGDSVKWMSYFDEVEALCAVQAAFSDDFSFALSEAAKRQSSSAAAFNDSVPAAVRPSAAFASPAMASIPASESPCAGDFSALTCPLPLTYSSVVTEDGAVDDLEALKHYKKKNMESCWSVHVRAMCKTCGINVKIDKDRVCSDAWSSSDDQVELTDANKALAEKIIRLRTYAFMLWQVFDTPADRRLFSLSQGDVSGVSSVAAAAVSSDQGEKPAQSSENGHAEESQTESATSSNTSTSVDAASSRGDKRTSEEEMKGPDVVRKKARESKAQLRRAIRDEDDITFY